MLKALEKEVTAFAGLNKITIKHRVHPRQLFGIETNPYAVELASIVIWIGYLQWKNRNAIPLDDEEPILQPLEQVQLMDAIVEGDHEPEWPAADIIVGNPPFLGGKMLRKTLGDAYVDELFAIWNGRVERQADLCCYWFEKARSEIEQGKTRRAGLLATQGIRGGANRRVLERIKESGEIFYAQADRPWIQAGVAVHVAMIGFDDGAEPDRLFNEDTEDAPEVALARAKRVSTINANLTAGSSDITTARRIQENVGISFAGDTKGRTF